MFQNSTNYSTRLVSGAAALLLVAGAAFGQAGAGGRALDRNLHAYDGPLNAPGARVEDQLRINNALITGNVSGGRSFRGFVGYRAPNEFGAHLGSNDLYSFRRDTALSAISGLNIRPSDALRYQFALSTGQAPPSYVAGGIAVTQRSGANPAYGAAAGSTTAAALRSTSDFLTGQSVRPALVGSRVDEQGHELTAKASPLMGINWVRSENPVVHVVRRDEKLAAEDLGATSRSAALSTTQPVIDTKRTIPGATGAEAGASNVPSALDREAMLRPLQPPQLRVESPVYAEVMDAFRTGFGTAPGTKDVPADTDTAEKPGTKVAGAKAKPEDMSLDAQLERLRKRMRPDAAGERLATTAWKPKPDKEDEEKEKPAPIDPNQRGLGDVLKTGREGAKPDADKRDRDKPTAKPGDRLSSSELLTPELARALKNTGSIRVERLSRVESDVKPAPNMPLYQAAMAAGESLFARRQYFDAEDRFTRALAAIPGDPMAMVGRAHAQLAGGLYLSAAANLRALFAAHPELIGTKYAETLVPPAERTSLIASQLRDEMERGSSALGRDAALLLAYIGHLRNDPKLVQDGVSEMKRRFDPDNDADQALIEATRAAWTK